MDGSLIGGRVRRIHAGPINAVFRRMRCSLLIAGRVIKAIVWKTAQRALCRLINVICHRTRAQLDNARYCGVFTLSQQKAASPLSCFCHRRSGILMFWWFQQLFNVTSVCMYVIGNFRKSGLRGYLHRVTGQVCIEALQGGQKIGTAFVCFNFTKY